jgi:tRNA(fMet)-specific endonuclease VapC
LILDTNALSAVADGDENLRRLIQQETELALPAIVLGEYLYGIQRSRYRARYEQWLEANLPMFDLLNVGLETARRYAEIRHELRTAGTPLPGNDLWIAALARQHRFSLVSRDQHFKAVRGLHLLSW